MVRDRTLYIFGTLLLALGVVRVLFQLLAHCYRAFVSLGLSYAVILVLAHELGWGSPGF